MQKYLGIGTRVGRISFQNGNILATASPLKKNTMFEIRSIFPNQYLQDAKEINEKKEEDIIKEELAIYQDIQNRSKMIKYTTYALGAIWAVSLLFTFIILPLKHRAFLNELRENMKTLENSVKRFDYYPDRPAELKLDMIKTLIFKPKKVSRKEANIFLSIILKLTYLGIIETNIRSDGEIEFKLNSEKYQALKSGESEQKNILLTEDDMLIYRYLRAADQDNDSTLTIKELRSKMESDYGEAVSYKLLTSEIKKIRKTKGRR